MKSLLIALSILIATPALMAAEAPIAPVVEQATTEAGMTLIQAWDYGGWIMWVLLVMSVFAAALCLYFTVIMRSRRVAPYALRRDLNKALTSDDPAEARRLCEDCPSPLSAIILVTLDAIRNAPKANYALIQNVAESEGSHQVESIQGQAQFLLDISTISPMVGLLGTVIGLLRAFGAVAANVAAAKPTLLAEGVSQAIVTTIFGLMIAIPAMMAYAYFRRRASQLIAELESASAELIAVIGGKYTQG